MCLVAIAWRTHPRYPLIVAGNRDEFHQRPTAPAAWWTDAQQVLGGRDMVAGGSWLAVSRGGRFAVVINDPRRPPGPERTASRGHLVSDFVAGTKPSGRFLDAVAVAESGYAGFCLIVGTPVQLRGFATSRAGSPHRWTLPRRISVFSNSPLEAPSPKVSYLENATGEALAAPQVDRETLFDALARRDPVAGGDGGQHPAGLTPFIVGELYGTRASTVVMVDTTGSCYFEERRFDASGALTGTTREQFGLAP